MEESEEQFQQQTLDVFTSEVNPIKICYSNFLGN